MLFEESESINRYLPPCPEDRNGRHWVRVELSTILIKYAFKISIQFWSRRDNSVVPLA
jgi:hypothetical protein